MGARLSSAAILMVPAVAPYALGGGTITHLCRRTGVVDAEVWFAREDITSGVDTMREYSLQIIRVGS